MRGAAGGVRLDPLTTDGEKARMEATLLQIRGISALMAGVPADMARMLEDQKKHEPVPLIKLWHQAKARGKG